MARSLPRPVGTVCSSRLLQFGRLECGSVPSSRSQRRWPLVGRSSELELIARARSAGASGIMVIGAAGVGKSRLAREALRGRPAGRRDEMGASDGERGHCAVGSSEQPDRQLSARGRPARADGKHRACDSRAGGAQATAAGRRRCAVARSQLRRGAVGAGDRRRRLCAGNRPLWRVPPRCDHVAMEGRRRRPRGTRRSRPNRDRRPGGGHRRRSDRAGRAGLDL